jgi:nucleotide-binding universal stress UspA family protein
MPPPIPPVSGWELELARLDQDQCLGGWLMHASALGRDYAVPVRLAVSAGRPATAIVHYAARRGSELVVIGRHAHRYWLGWLYGTAATISRQAPCPVLVVP